MTKKAKNEEYICIGERCYTHRFCKTKEGKPCKWDLRSGFYKTKPDKFQ